MSEYGCHIDLPEGQHDNCVLDGGNRDDCIYARKYGEEGRNKCGEWKPVKIVESSPSDALSSANIHIAKLQALVAERDAMLGKRPCQNSRCNELNAARALLREVMEYGVKMSLVDDTDVILTNKVRAYLDACYKPREPT